MTTEITTFESVPPHRLSKELRLAEGKDMRRRRQVIGLSLAGAVIGGVVGAYQTGILRRLPDILPGRIWNAEKVDRQDYAYEKLQTADGLIMLNSYGTTAILAAAGGKDRTERQPTLPLAAAAKAGYDFYTCLKLAGKEWQETKALCSWCQVATAVSAISLVLTLPEAARAARNIS
ncbi:MAG: vitamin K epoxide reductase family protein [Pacificimonas sp.]|jgi:hypothetical protein|nr:vitamin K epoxide reductase family protein [Pacificimonas sp.]